MRLRKLEIAGFKSFMNKLEMEFSVGITAVVGPNGCGKSNIVDSIRWVLGEQKTRLLRNTKMENVIFNGTKLKQPLGMAEVNLSLTNEDRTLPIDYNEVTITRRLHRSGLSEYCINNELSRLKSVKGLLFDTGLGNQAYSIIEREMIEAVLSDKEQDKKNMFEEAAGIMRYRMQREEALRKIKLTETDITRLEDILAELDKEIRSLRYQRGRAKKYMKLKDKVDGMESSLLKKNLYDLLAESGRIKSEKARQEEVTLVDESEISLMESRLQEKRIEGSSLERGLQNVHERRYNLSRELQGNDEKIAVAKERIKSCKNRINENEGEIEKAARRIKDLEEELKSLKEDANEKRELIRQIRNEIPKKESVLEELTKRYEEAKSILRDKKQLVLDLAGGDGLKNHMAKTVMDLIKKKNLHAERNLRMRIEEKELSEKAADKKQDLNKQKDELDKMKTALKHLSERKEKILELKKDCDSQMTQATIDINRLADKKALLETIKREHNLQVLGGEEAGNGILGVLADLVRVKKKEYRKCFEACLAPALNSVVAATKEDAIACVGKLRKAGNGGANFLYPVESKGTNEAGGKGIVGYAEDLIECDAKAGAHIRSLLNGVLVVENVDSALQLLNSHSEKRVATLDGVFFDGPGRIFASSSDAIEMSTLDFNTKLKEIEQNEKEAAARSDRCRRRKSEIHMLEDRLAAEEEELEQRAACAADSEKELSGSYREMEIRLVRVREQLANGTAVVKEMEKSEAELNARMAEIKAKSEENGKDETVADISIAEEEAAALECRREELKDEIARQRLQEATIDGEMNNLDTGIRNIGKLIEELQGLIISRRDDIGTAGGQVEAGSIEITTLGVETGKLHEQKDNIEKEIERINSDYEEIKNVCDKMETELKEIKAEREKKREILNRFAEKLAAQEARIAGVLDQSKEKFNEDISRFVEGKDTLNPQEWEEMNREEFDVLRRKLESFGPVNMLALEEYNDRKERYEFLMKQKADLVEARDALMAAIRRINREARKMLNETFEKIRANFKATFLSLFDGGEADLEFIDSDDPLEANIRIVASPKGKKLHDISSLSGGERALVALSLLFAIYLVKPSPFCIFDEVDAPLDDANVGRFINMLKSFTDRTQFIVITHNKKTMEAADFIYGITMEEPGVSKIISVQISDVDRLKARHEKAEKTAMTGQEIPIQA